jgi:hypothetical protein
MSQEKQRRIVGKQVGTRIIDVLLIGAILMAGSGVVLSGLLALFVVPAPDANTAVEVSGRLQRISPPHPEYGDLTINLTDGRSFYVNRANEVAYFAWERLIEQVNPGDVLRLTVVRPLAWRLFGFLNAPGPGPVAGVRTEAAVYMDPAIPAATWTAQATYVRSAVLLLAVLLGLMAVFLRVRVPRNSVSGSR